MDGFNRPGFGVKFLLLANLIVFLLQLVPMVGSGLMNFGALVPARVFGNGEIWRLVTYMFMHSSDTMFHLLFNMFAVWMFGMELEERFGTKKFLVFYFVCGIGSGLFSVFYMFSPVMGYTSIIGASGAVYGLLTAFAFFSPNREILLFFVVPIRAWVLVAGYAVISLLSAMSERGGVVAHLVHLGGIAIAFLYLKYGPNVVGWIDEWNERNRQQATRLLREEKGTKDRFFSDTIDPILDKINREGVGSLTKEEKALLERAARHKKGLLTKNKIIPFDAFKKDPP